MDWTAPNPDYPPPKADEPPLHRAARLGEHAAIAHLVQTGADVNEWFNLALDPGGRDYRATPLMVAAGSGCGASVETMRLLVSLGADQALRGAAGSIAFFAAQGLGWNYPPGGDADRLRFGLSAGCDPNEKDARDICLLAAAAITGDVARVRVLLEAGASPNPAWDRDAALARHRGFQEFFKTNPDTLPPPTAPSLFQIPLFCAVEADSFEAVQALVDAGADVRVTDDSQRNALFLARSATVARFLVDRGVDLEARNRWDWTPLMDAAGKSYEQVQTLLAAGANPNATCDHGYTVFMHAASGMERKVETLAALVAAGADPLAVSELGYNALHAAIDVNGEANAPDSVRSIITYLVRLGVPLDARNDQGETPLDRARNWGTEIEVAVLEELG